MIRRRRRRRGSVTLIRRRRRRRGSVTLIRRRRRCEEAAYLPVPHGNLKTKLIMLGRGGGGVFFLRIKKF